MKKKVIAVALYIALLMTSVFPATALAEGEAEGGPEAPDCICATKCSEGSVDPNCPVCSAEGADLSACKGPEPQPMNEQDGGDTTSPNGQGDGQGSGSTPTPAPTVPVCACTVKCSEGTGNPDCPVCGAAGADLSACAGKAAESSGDENDSTPAPAPSPVCTCTAKCAEGAVNNQCPVCAADWNNCAFTGETDKPEGDNKPETVTVTGWSWVDEQGILAADGKLYLPSAVTAESLEGIKASLPQYIQAGGEKIALTWTYDEATGIFTAALPEGYALAEGAKILTVETVDMGADTLENEPVNYIDEDKQIQNCSDYTLVTAGDTAWSDTTGGWYVLNSDVAIGSRVKVTGNVHLILADGCKLTVNGGIEVAQDNSLTIYAQSGGTGELIASATDAENAGIGGRFNLSCGTVTLNGGMVKATGAGLGAGIGGSGFGGIGGDITVNGGIVEAIGGSSGDGIGGTGGNIAVNDGQVTARTGGSGAGIGGSRGNITISGGTVQATGKNGGAGIGGTSGAVATVTIKGGIVIATGESGGDGIGGTVTIEGGSVTATATNGNSIDGSVTVRPEQNYCIAVLTGYSQDNATAVEGSPFNEETVITDLVSNARYFSSHMESASIAVTSISLDETELKLKVGSTATLNATVNPADASNKELSWSSSDPNVASVDSATGVITALKAGTATITAAATDGSNVKAECKVTVIIPVTSVTMSRSSLRIYEGGSYSLSAAVSPDNATDKTLSWSSSDPSIASVDKDGKVTAHKAGTAIIYAAATDGSGVKAECTVTVDVPVSSVTMSRTSLRIYEGRGYTLSATVMPDNAADKGIVWSSSDPSVASVDQDGRVTAHKRGACIIYAQAQDGSGVYGYCTVQVLRWYPGATPITGDSSNLGLWIGVLAVSAVAIGAAAFILVKKRKKK